MRTKQTGATAVEFAMVLPLLLLLFDGVMEFSILMYDQAIIDNAARVAARAGIVVQSPKIPALQIREIVLLYTDNNLLSFSDEDILRIEVISSQNSNYQTPLTVNVSYTFNGLLSGSILSAIKEPITLTASSTQLNE